VSDLDNFVQQLISLDDAGLRLGVSLVANPNLDGKVDTSTLPAYETDLNLLAPFMEGFGLALVPANKGGWCCIDLTTESIDDSDVTFSDVPTIAFHDAHPARAVCKAVIMAWYLLEHTNAGG
jgi:hypothetical protein